MARGRKEENREALVRGLDTTKAKTTFIHDATKVASEISKKLCLGEFETISLFVNKKTGHIRIWCRENEPVTPLIEMRNDTLYRKMLWRVRGPSN